MSSFRPYVWDPALIIGQMTCIQSTFYTSECILLILAHIVGRKSTLDQVFTTQPTFDTTIVQLLSTVVCAFALVRVVQRARQCLDFVCTYHLFHLIAVIVYTRTFPTKFLWWASQLLGVIVCTVVGEYLCKKFESREIQLSQPSKYDL